MRSVNSVGVTVIAIVVNAVALHKLGFTLWMLPVLLTSILLALEATSDAA